MPRRFNTEERSIERKGTRALIAAVIAAGGLALSSELRTSAAEAAPPRNPVLVRTESHLETVVSAMKDLIRFKSPRAYRETARLSGQEITRLVVSYKEPNKIQGTTLYDQVVADFKPGDRLPYETIIIQATTNERYKVGELAYFGISELYRISDQPREYYWDKVYPDANGKPHTDKFILSATDPMSAAAERKDQMLGDFTDQANQMIQAAAGALSN